jgi:hypothetical protein
VKIDNLKFDIPYFFNNPKNVNDNTICWDCIQCKETNKKQTTYKADIGVTSNLKSHVKIKHLKFYDEWVENNRLKLSDLKNPSTPKQARRTINIFATPMRTMEPYVVVRKQYGAGSQPQEYHSRYVQISDKFNPYRICENKICLTS